VLGPDHPHTLIARRNLARWRGEAGDPVGPAEEFRRLHAACPSVLGPDHPDTLIARSNLGAVGRGDPFGHAARSTFEGDIVRLAQPQHPAPA
jgi:hypothetical protein